MIKRTPDGQEYWEDRPPEMRLASLPPDAPYDEQQLGNNDYVAAVREVKRQWITRQREWSPSYDHVHLPEDYADEHGNRGVHWQTFDTHLLAFNNRTDRDFVNLRMGDPIWKTEDGRHITEEQAHRAFLDEQRRAQEIVELREAAGLAVSAKLRADANPEDLKIVAEEMLEAVKSGTFHSWQQDRRNR